MKLLLLTILTWNVITFIMMGIDKLRAKKDLYRISEKTLIISSFVMGAVGVVLGMIVFHHKTRKLKFKVLIPISIICNAAIIYGLFYYNLI